MIAQQNNNIWIIIGHPRQLTLALVLTKYFSSQYPCHLVISRHKYWQTINLEEYRALFKSITIFEPIYHTHSIKELFQMISNLFKTKAAMRKLPIKPDDILISLEVWNYIENLMTTVWHKNKQFLIYPERIDSFVSLTHSEIYSQKNRYITKSGYLHFFLDKILGLKKQNFYYWLRDGEKQYEHGIAYSKPVQKLYTQVFVLKSIFKENLKDNEIYYPYYSLRTANSKTSGKKMVVFFISGYVSNKEYNLKISKILQNLRKHYGEQYDLQIRLHPNQLDSDSQFDCRGWKINKEMGNAQLFLTRHADEIKAAFTDKSSGQSFPLNMGIESYSYHRALGLKQDVVDWFDNTYQDAPREFFLETLDALPCDYEPVRDGLEKSQNSLNKLHDELTAPLKV